MVLVTAPSALAVARVTIDPGAPRRRVAAQPRPRDRLEWRVVFAPIEMPPSSTPPGTPPSGPPGVPHRISRPRRPSRAERGLRRIARGTGSAPVNGPAIVPRAATSPRARTAPASKPRLTLIGLWGIVGVAA